ncbi:DNA cytosine methyltransferase [Nostoc sp. CHAB 5834]|nr:DNA cytosine methyltransferase [Nostoc sp. CHAB 5834]
MKQHYDIVGDEVHRRLITNGAVHLTRISDIADAGQSAEGAWWQSVLRGQRPISNGSGGKLRVVDAFCGSGGLALGIRYAAEAFNRDLDFQAIIDSDAEALKVHQANLGAKRAIAQSVTRLVDYSVREIGEAARFAYPPELINDDMSKISNVDLFIAGPPCQGHSNLNNHTRRQDPRNDLYVTSVALAVACGAKAVLIENVPTVQNSHSDVVATAIGLLRDAGYSVSTAVLKADECGSAQRRSRFFILAILGDKLQTNALSDFAFALRSPEQPLSWAIGDLLDKQGDGVWDQSPVATQVNLDRIDYLFDHDLHNLPDDQRPDCHKNGTTYTAVYGRMHWDRPSQTITTGFGTPGQGRYIHPLRRRLITPHEAARIQGYPDWFNFSPAGSPLKRKNLSKWIGDAVHPALGYVAGLLCIDILDQLAADNREVA